MTCTSCNPTELILPRPRKAARRPEFSCRACGGRGCRCHVTSRLRHARPVFHVSGDAPQAFSPMWQSFVVIEAPRPEPCRPQGPPAAFSKPLKSIHGKGNGYETRPSSP